MTTMKMDIGGAETHILEAAKELTHMGHRVTVASAGGVFVPELQAAGVTHVEAPLHTRHPGKVLVAAHRLRHLIRDGGFDVVHAHARIPALLCHLLCKHYRVRFVTTAHLDFCVNWIWRLLTRWGERTVAVSDDIKQYLIDDYGVCSDNITVTINGIDLATYTPDIDTSAVREEFGLTADKHRIVCVSRMDTDRSEAAIQLAEIAPRLYSYDDRIELLLVGGGNDFARLQAAADRANAAIGHRAVILTGPRTDINRLLATGDFFVGVSRAALEAMAMEKPVILAGNQGYLGIFTNDKFDAAYQSNFCCRGEEATSREALYRDVTALLSMSAEQRAVLGHDCRDVIAEHYSVSRMARDYLAMYEAVRPYKPFRYGDILFCGYYGFRNMGDDSLLRAIIANIREIEPDAHITVMSKNPRETKAIYGTHAVNRFSPFSVLHAMRHGRLLIFGGGNLLQDGSSARSLLYYTAILQLAKRCGMKIMVYANGIGPLRFEKSRKAAANALNLADLITLRETDSIRECAALGVDKPRILATADPAFTLKEADVRWTETLCAKFGIKEGTRYFVVALRDFKTEADKNTKEIAAACDRIHDACGLIPIFLPMHDPLDRAVNRAAAALCRCETVFLEGLTGGEVLGILRRTEFVLAMRLHTLIYSTAVGTPSMGLAYDGKLRAFMETMELPYMLDAVDAAQIFDCAGQLLAQRGEIRRILLDKRDELRRLAMEDAHAAVSFIKPESEGAQTI